MTIREVQSFDLNDFEFVQKQKMPRFSFLLTQYNKDEKNLGGSPQI